MIIAEPPPPCPVSPPSPLWAPYFCRQAAYLSYGTFTSLQPFDVFLIYPCKNACFRASDAFCVIHLLTILPETHLA